MSLKPPPVVFFIITTLDIGKKKNMTAVKESPGEHNNNHSSRSPYKAGPGQGNATSSLNTLIFM